MIVQLTLERLNNHNFQQDLSAGKMTVIIYA